MSEGTAKPLFAARPSGMDKAECERWAASAQAAWASRDRRVIDWLDKQLRRMDRRSQSARLLQPR